ncbi:hypothetical protein VTN96DRAFT_1234 [Rasamsonia emersonii]
MSVYPAETTSGVVTSWIPLTTVWTASAGCSDSFRLDGPSLVAFDPGYGLDIDHRVICQPPAVTTWWEQGLLGGGDQSGHTAVNILPLTCPEGFSTVVTSTRDHSSTLAMCCPSGYYLANGQTGQVEGDCLSTVLPGMTLTYASAPATESTAWTIVTTTLTSSSTVGAIAVVGWNVASPTTTTSSATSLASTGSATSSTVFTTSSAIHSAAVQTSSSSSVRPSDNLSTGDKAGIGVGVSLGIIELIALLWTVLLLRRKRAEPTTTNNNNNNNQGTMDTFKGLLPPYSEVQYHPAPPLELPGQWDPPELADGQQRSPVELE